VLTPLDGRGCRAFIDRHDIFPRPSNSFCPLPMWKKLLLIASSVLITLWLSQACSRGVYDGAWVSDVHLDLIHQSMIVASRQVDDKIADLYQYHKNRSFRWGNDEAELNQKVLLVKYHSTQVRTALATAQQYINGKGQLTPVLVDTLRSQVSRYRTPTRPFDLQRIRSSMIISSCHLN